MIQEKIAIIGGGNLGKSIAKGLLQGEVLLPKNISVTRRNVNMLEDLAAMGMQTFADNKAAVKQSKIVILAIKPYQIENVIAELKEVLSKDKIVISVVTGVSIEDLQRMVSAEGTSIYRAMPNTAISVQQSMTCISKAEHCKDDELVLEIFNSLGKTVMIEDSLMDAATVLAACGIAYAMRFIRANIQGGIEIGFDARTAAIIAAQTAKGAAELLLTQNTHPEEEIDKVTTPKGCTISGLNEMEHRGFSSSLIRGVVASYNKIKK